MEIYLDANATTPVLAQAREAALAAMGDLFGNPSSVHGSGLRARAILQRARAAALRVLGASQGRVLFTSGATEGIQTAVLSALMHLRDRPQAGLARPTILYGATEHKAVPEAIKHWTTVLCLPWDVVAIPVKANGQHDLAWLEQHLPSAGLVCTMAANNETGVVSDLEGLQALMAPSNALWLVDGVQALGKLDLQLARRRIDYAPFSGHKLYGPKGIGMLYVRDGAPFTPLIAGGGQESALRSGTENMAGIAALGAVLEALESGTVFASHATMARRRDQLASALNSAFPGVVFNAPLDKSLPTTLNFSVPGVSSRLLLDLFDAAGLRMSGGSACGASKAQPSYVLQAMGLPDWQTSSAVRLSFGAADDATLVDEACERLRACGEALRATCQSGQASPEPTAPGLFTRFVVDGACCYVVADAESQRCVVVDPLPQLTQPLVQWIQCRGLKLAAVLDTHHRSGLESSAAALRAAASECMSEDARLYTWNDSLGWPIDATLIALGRHWISRRNSPGAVNESSAYLVHAPDALVAVLAGETLTPGDQRTHEALQDLADAVGMEALLLPGHDPLNTLATTPSAALRAQEHRTQKDVECQPAQIRELLQAATPPVLIDVREDYETRVGAVAGLNAEAIALSALANALPRLRALPEATPVVFICRSGNRSAQAARALRRLGHQNTWSLAGGLAFWPAQTTQTAHAR